MPEARPEMERASAMNLLRNAELPRLLEVAPDLIGDLVNLLLGLLE